MFKVVGEVAIEIGPLRMKWSSVKKNIAGIFFKLLLTIEAQADSSLRDVNAARLLQSDWATY